MKFTQKNKGKLKSNNSQNIGEQYLDGLSIDQTVRMRQFPIQARNNEIGHQ